MPDSKSWRVRVIPNKYPAASPDPSGCTVTPRGCLAIAPEAPLGAHEVIIESPRHVVSFASLSVEELAEVFGVFAARMRHWGEDPRMRYAFVFKNEGYAAGASLHHVHSQLLALPELPPVAAVEMEIAESHFQRHGEVLLVSILEAELASGERVIAANDAFVALSAQAARQPYEMLIVPRTRQPRFGDVSAGQCLLLASMLREILLRLSTLLRPLSYNLVFRSAPFDARYEPFFQWYLELIPRSCRLAGFEWGSGLFINPLSPERAAVDLRAILGSVD